MASAGKMSSVREPGAAEIYEFLAESLKMRWKRYRKRLKQCQRKFSEGAVHDSRIETRRLLSLIDMLRVFLPEAGLNIDPVLYKDLPFRDYGDPRSKSVAPSNGPGNGGGIGTNQGQGIGEGDGSGFGPGNKRNMGGRDPNDGCCGSGGSSDNNPNNDIDRIFRVPEVTTRARVLSKPEPQYTEEARRGGITGTVTLSVVFSRTGQVTNIRAVQSLCCGLTEKAIAAARQIRFIPATREGRAVSMYMQLEYNFNLY